MSKLFANIDRREPAEGTEPDCPLYEIDEAERNFLAMLFGSDQSDEARLQRLVVCTALLNTAWLNAPRGVSLWMEWDKDKPTYMKQPPRVTVVQRTGDIVLFEGKLSDLRFG